LLAVHVVAEEVSQALRKCDAKNSP